MKDSKRGLMVIAVIALLAVVAYYAWDLLHARSIYEIQAEIIHLEDTRALSDDLTDYLDHSSPYVRARAALAVGRIGGKDAGKLLFEMIGDSSTDVGATAAFALGLTGEKKYAAEILDYVFELPSAVGAAAVEAAGRLADSSMTNVASALTEYLSHPSPDVRAAACRALFLANAKSQAGAIIGLLEEEPDDEVRAEAVYALSRLQNLEAEEIYANFVADPDPFVRTAALRGLARIGGPKAEHYLSIAMNDANRQVVAQGIVELGRFKTPGAHKLLARRLEIEQDEKHIVTLLEAARRQESDAAIARATELVQTDSAINVVGAAVKYLAAIQGDRAVNLIDSLMLRADSRMKVACAEAYGLTRQKNVVPRLATMITDEDPMVRAAAYSELVTLDSGNVTYYIDKALNDRDPVLVAQAINQIEAGELGSYTSALVAMMGRGGEIDIDIRRSLVEASGSLLQKNPSDSLLMSILVSGLIDKEYIVRREAAVAYETVIGQNRSDRVPPASTRISVSEIAKALESAASTGSNPSVRVTTERGGFVIELYVNAAPLTVLNFLSLVRDGFYDGLSFHRVVPNFVTQGGDPHGDGWGGPDYFIRDEYSRLPFKRGAVGIATSGKDTGGSQFFVTLSPQPHLEARYTVFGQVTAGMDVVDELVWGDIIQKMVVEEGK